MMHLRIENGVLLKPYALPWRKDGFVRILGWTPERSSPWIQNRIAEIEVARAETLNTKPLPELIAQQAEAEYGKELQDARQPWRGWIPVSAVQDRRISRAYRQLFVRMNPEHKDPVMQMKLRGGRSRVIFPPDGEYTYANGKMETDAGMSSVRSDVQQSVPLELSWKGTPGTGKRGESSVSE